MENLKLNVLTKDQLSVYVNKPAMLSMNLKL